MTIGLSIDTAVGPREPGQPYVIRVDLLNLEIPFVLEPGMQPGTVFKYWAFNDSMIGGKLILTRGSDLLWEEKVVSNTFGDPLNDPSAVQVERTIPEVSYGEEIWIRTGSFASAWLTANPSDEDRPEIQSYSVVPPGPYIEGDAITLTVVFSEQLVSSPTVAINGNSVTETSFDGTTYVGTYTLQSTEVGSSFVINISAEDLAGNTEAFSLTVDAEVEPVKLITASPGPGVYSSGIDVTLATLGTGIIRYSVDGSDPRTYLSSIYSDPIPVSINTTIKATLIDNNIPSEVIPFEYFIPSSVGVPTSAPSIYPLYERDTVVNGEGAVPDGTLVHVRVNQDEFQGQVTNNHYSVATIALQLGDVVSVSLEDRENNMGVSQWVIARPSVRADDYVIPELRSYWGSNYPVAAPVEIYRGDSITLEFPLMYQGSPLVLPSGTMYLYITPSRWNKTKLLEKTMYTLPSGNWAANVDGELSTTGTYWGEISIEKPGGGQVTLQAFPVYVIEDLRP